MDSSVVVTRKVTGSLDDVVARVPGLIGGLVLRAPFAVVPTTPVKTWATTGRLSIAGAHVAKFARVEVEISEYSDHACLVEVRPVSQNSPRWGQRRFDRYFHLAHRAADEIAGVLTQVSFHVAA